MKSFLDEKVDRYNNITFIENDPISIPHLFSGREDREIMGFFAAMLAWGQRKTIISKCRELVQRFGGEPLRFIREHGEDDLKGLLGFTHRTFNDTDLLYFVDFLHRHYASYATLEDAFLDRGVFHSMEDSLIRFEQTFFDDPAAPHRTRKHVATPLRNSACKRINMFMRWMVRSDDRGVDFGIWKRIPQNALICPIDLHVDRTARRLGLITRKQTDWKTALELTENLRLLDPFDPVKYDFALFGLSLESGR
ncbi:TIGR02757 family protein [Proteiniphilum sp.]|uniref:TIGR02757 family protein n=1 Tax=Proteiniphilum sp. TaxID=1926877 RepID=UPI002B1FB137|nr:TIGR02757 family protein [Proteiniphilum sp.]MEA4916458.1 TIGR02757 family protein [Proteiniphilum sp.]